MALGPSCHLHCLLRPRCGHHPSSVSLSPSSARGHLHRRSKPPVLPFIGVCPCSIPALILLSSFSQTLSSSPSRARVHLRVPSLCSSDSTSPSSICPSSSPLHPSLPCGSIHLWSIPAHVHLSISSRTAPLSPSWWAHPFLNRPSTCPSPSSNSSIHPSSRLSPSPLTPLQPAFPWGFFHVIRLSTCPSLHLPSKSSFLPSVHPSARLSVRPSLPGGFIHHSSMPSHLHLHLVSPSPTHPFLMDPSTSSSSQHTPTSTPTLTLPPMPSLPC